MSATPGGRTRDTSATVEYTLPAADGESESAAKRRDEQHWHREASTVRSLDLSGAAEAHAAREAERQRVARACEREIADVLDRVIVRVSDSSGGNGARARYLCSRGAALQAALSAGCQEGLACALEHIDYSSFCRVIVECG